jgi:LysM repeat protein/predicted chitinase
MGINTQRRPRARPSGARRPDRVAAPAPSVESNSDAAADLQEPEGSQTPLLDQLLVGPTQPVEPTTYVVQRGDTLSRIASAFGVSLASLIEANGIRDPNRIQAGATLVIPAAPAPTTEGAPSAGGAVESSSSPMPRPEGRSWVIQRGDSLWALSQRFGVSVDDLVRANGLRNPDRIRVGQVLVIPGSAPSPVTPAPEGTAPEQEAPAPEQEAPAPEQEAPAPEQEAPAPEQAPALPAAEVDAALAPAVAAVLAQVPADQRPYAESSVPIVLASCVRRGVRLVDQAAYILATTEHESRFGKPLYSRSESLVEDHNPYSQQGDGSWSARVHTSGRTVTAASEQALDVAYWDAAYGGRLDNQSGTEDAANYRGRGFVQLTGRTNYERMSERLNRDGFQYTLDGQTWGGAAGPIDLLANPDHVNRSEELAAEIMVLGCVEGSFTGRGLGDHINEQGTDYYQARAVVNGDKEKNGYAIAEMAQRYSAALAPHWAALFPVA